MVKAKANHRNIDSGACTVTGQQRLTAIILTAAPSGGFTVGAAPREDRFYSLHTGAAFTTLDEALTWLAVNMA